MKKIALLLILINPYVSYTQSNIRNPNIVHLNGPLIRFHTYRVQFDSLFRGYVTFNNHPISEINNHLFSFIAENPGYLRAYDTSNNKSKLVLEEMIRVRNPEYTVTFHNIHAGGVIKKDDLKDANLYVTVLNADIEISF